MISLMKKVVLALGAALLVAVPVLETFSEPSSSRPHGITDPEVYIPLREEMTRMEMKFVDVQLLSASDKVDYAAILKALDQMEAASKKIRSINPREALREPLQKLGEQIEGLQRDARRKDPKALKADLDRIFETCFKCHQAHAPMM